jgi:uncharacterized protein YggE
MNKILISSFLMGWVAIGAQAQSGARRPFVQAVGQASVSIKPDLAKIDIGVVTQGATAQDASTQNATRLSAVLTALQAVLGLMGDIRTVNYTLTPNYNYPPNGGTPTLLGYTATNTVEVTSTDLANIGKVIDTAAQAGANTIQSLQFTLKDDQPARAQALKAATQQAKAHADAIAAGVGGRTGAVLAGEEGGSVSITPIRGAVGATAPATPVEPGPVQVTASVTLEIELIQ